MTLAIVQHGSSVSSLGSPGAITLGSTPTPGNYLIVFLGTNDISYSTFNTTDWNVLNWTGAVTNIIGSVLGRIVQSGDTTTTPIMSSGAFTWYGYTWYEISGGSGDINADIFTMLQYESGAVSGTSWPTLPTFQNGTLAITAGLSYRTASAPTFTGSGWTNDENASNPSGWGGAVSYSKSLNSGDTIDGTWTTVGGPDVSFILMMNPTAQGTYHIRRARSDAKFQISGYQLPFTPIVGNLLTVNTVYRDGTSAAITPGTGWTTLDTVAGAGPSTPIQVTVGHYVQIGDGFTISALPSVFDFLGFTVLEMGGVAGTFSDDVVGFNHGYQASGTSITTGTRNSDLNNQYVVLFYGNWQGGANAAIPSGWDTINNQNAGQQSWFTGLKQVPTAGTSIGGDTITAPVSGNPQSYTQMFLGAPINGAVLGVDTQTYAVDPQTVAFIISSPTIVVDVNGYAVAGHNINFEIIVGSIGLDTNSYAVAAQNITFTVTYKMIVGPQAYNILGQRINLDFNFRRHFTFSQPQRDDFKDWAQVDAEAHFQTFQMTPDPALWTQAPYIYVFLKPAEETSVSSDGAELTALWNWATLDNDPKTTPVQEVYQFRNGYLTAVARRRLRGKGRSISLRFDSEAEKNFNVLGWALHTTSNAQQ